MFSVVVFFFYICNVINTISFNDHYARTITHNTDYSKINIPHYSISHYFSHYSILSLNSCLNVKMWKRSAAVVLSALWCSIICCCVFLFKAVNDRSDHREFKEPTLIDLLLITDWSSLRSQTECTRTGKEEKLRSSIHGQIFLLFLFTYHYYLTTT